MYAVVQVGGVIFERSKRSVFPNSYVRDGSQNPRCSVLQTDLDMLLAMREYLALLSPLEVGQFADCFTNDGQ